MAHTVPHIHVQDGELELRMAPSVPFWRCEPLMIALGIALLLHLVPFALFYVPQTTVAHDTLPAFPVTAVADHLAVSENTAYAHVEADRRMRVLAPPHSAYPSLPALMDIPASVTLENMVLGSLEFDLPASTPHVRGGLRWLMSGPLANEKLRSSLVGELMIAPTQDLRLRFAVQVDQQVGRILWIQTLEPSSDALLHAQMEKIIRQIRFQPHRCGGVIHGELEVWVYGEETS